MSWTTPRTWIANEVLTADHLNAQIRDNLMHCAPHIAQGQGSYIVSSGENQLALRKTYRATLLDADTRTALTYGNGFDTEGPEVTLETDNQCLIIFACDARNSNDGASFFASVQVSGATTIAADDDWAIRVQTEPDCRTYASNFMFFKTLNKGTNTFKMVYKVGGSGTITFLRRRIMAMPF